MAIGLTFIATSNANAFVAGPDFFGLDFRFSNPGARANAMGGAFIGLADDASAAYTNPAGLTILTSPEFSLEFKGGEYTTRTNDRRGETDYPDNSTSLSFLSYAYPTEKVTFTLFRHTLVDSTAEFDFTDNGTVVDHAKISTNITALGMGMGMKVNDTFSLGLTVGFAQLDYDSFNKSLEAAPDSPAGYDNYAISSANENDTFYTFSFLWNMVGELNLGMVYRMGSEFEPRKTEYRYNTTVSGYVVDFDAEHTIKVPDVYGAGLSYRFPKDITAALDVSYITYSDLTNNLLSRNMSGAIGPTSDMKIDDETEVRFGLEYIIDLKEHPLALRCGYYYRPDHKVYFTGIPGSMGSVEPYLVKGDDDHIFSGGVGFLLSDNVQIDLALSSGTFITEGYFSLVYRFEK